MSEKKFSMAEAIKSGWTIMLAFTRAYRTRTGKEEGSAESPGSDDGEVSGELRQEMPEAAQGETPEELLKEDHEKGRRTCAKGVMYINLEG